METKIITSPDAAASVTGVGSRGTKTEFFKTLRVLNQSLRVLEKEQHSQLSAKKNSGEPDVIDLYETHITNELQRKQEQAVLSQRLRTIRQIIGQFRHESTQAVCQSQQQRRQRRPECLALLKTLSEQIELATSGFKDDHLRQYAELCEQEKVTSREVDYLEKKIGSWTVTPDTAATTATTTTTTAANKSSSGGEQQRNEQQQSSAGLISEVVDFDKFIASTGGHTGGWDPIDHNQFLKLRHKHNNSNTAAAAASFIDELVGLVVTKTRSQIEEHNTWYSKYLALGQLKKQAILRWKESKQLAKSATVNVVEAEIKLNQEIDKELQSRFRKQAEQERHRKLVMLKQWKSERELDKAREEEEARAKQAKRLAKEQQEMLRKMEIKERLAEFNKQKQELNEYIQLEQQMLRESESEARKAVAKQQINTFQQRDLTQLRDKQAKMRARIREAELKQQRMERLKERIEVERDPQRLYQLTSTWQHRLNTPRSPTAADSSSMSGGGCGGGMHSSRSASGSCGALYSARIPHLAVPAWRQNI